jgi:hypothetical protein
MHMLFSVERRPYSIRNTEEKGKERALLIVLQCNAILSVSNLALMCALVRTSYEADQVRSPRHNVGISFANLPMYEPIWTAYASELRGQLLPSVD